MSTVDRILQLVEESGLTAKEYAINAGLGAGNITDWKTGRSKPSVESLQKIAKYANVSIEWLTGNSEFKTETENFNNYIKMQDKQIMFDFIEAHLKEFLVAGIKPDKFDDFLKLIIPETSSISWNQYTEKIQKYIQNFNPMKRNKLKKLINQLFNELAKNEKQRYFYNNYVSTIKQSSQTLDSQYYMCPVYGRISAGQPNWAEECIEGRIPIDPELMDIINPEEYFFLRVNGESMNKVVKNGAYALIHKQDMVDNGEIAVVLVNGDEATLKHFSKKGDIVVLTPESDDIGFEQQIYSKETPIKVIGKYVGKMEINK